jgi:transposase-like protein
VTSIPSPRLAAAHRAKLHSTNRLERLNGEIKPRTEVVVGVLSGRGQVLL